MRPRGLEPPWTIQSTRPVTRIGPCMGLLRSDGCKLRGFVDAVDGLDGVDVVTVLTRRPKAVVAVVRVTTLRGKVGA